MIDIDAAGIYHNSAVLTTRENWLWHVFDNLGCVRQRFVIMLVSISELLTILFPHLADLRMTRVFKTGRSVRIQASTHDPQAACPACGVGSRRVHSRYERRVSDTAVSGRETLIRLRVRRFFLLNEACSKKISSEQVPGLTVRYGRRSIGLGETLRTVALAVRGRAGARLSRRLATTVSRMTLLRIIRAMPNPASCDRCGCWASMTSPCAVVTSTAPC
ncbi:MAG: transposase family protein [Actinoallomurus sp.]